MALTYDLRAVDTDGIDPEKTKTMIFMTMAAGIGELTESTAPEFYARIRLWDLVKGHDTPTATIEDVKSHIGMKTNVTYENRKAWVHRITDSDIDYGIREYEDG